MKGNGSVKSIGILYICTGPYALFWENFHRTFDEYFLSNTEKRYFVFTDSEKLLKSDNDRVKFVRITNLPWPLITLLRFHIFLSIRDDLEKCDYLMFSNANIVCDMPVTEGEFLPHGEQKLFVTSHPGYCGKKKIEYPYDRNPKSLAYIPWNCGRDYVIGAMFGGKTDAFLEMCCNLKSNIDEDLKKNIIARWHDESHLNRYIVGRNDVKILAPEYCYPFGMSVSYPKRISAVSKQAKFDVKRFKGQYSVERSSTKKFFDNIQRKLKVKEHILLIIDTILQKKL